MRKVFVPLFDALEREIEQFVGMDASQLGELVPFRLEYNCFRLGQPADRSDGGWAPSADAGTLEAV